MDPALLLCSFGLIKRAKPLSPRTRRASCSAARQLLVHKKRQVFVLEGVVNPALLLHCCCLWKGPTHLPLEGGVDPPLQLCSFLFIKTPGQFPLEGGMDPALLLCSFWCHINSQGTLPSKDAWILLCCTVAFNSKMSQATFHSKDAWIVLCCSAAFE